MGNRKSIIRSRRAEQVSRQVEQKWPAYLSTLSERYGLILGSSALETGECWLRPPRLGGQLPMQFPGELQRVIYEEFVHFVHCNGYCPTCKAGHLLPTFAPYSWAQNDECPGWFGDASAQCNGYTRTEGCWRWTSAECVLEKCSVILDPWIQALDPIDDDLANPLIPREIELSNLVPKRYVGFRIT